MAGNVDEWTKTKYDTKEYSYNFAFEEELGRGKSLVLRGGSCDDDHRGARCAYRLGT